MVDIIERKVRNHGLECPLHPTQVLTYFIFGFDILSYYFIDMVSLAHNLPLIIALGTVYFICCTATTYYGYLAARINPADPTILLESKCKKHVIVFDSSSYEYHCSICSSHVLSGSKHCG